MDPWATTSDDPFSSSAAPSADFGDGFGDLGSSADAFGSGSDPFAADFGAPTQQAAFPATSDPFGGGANPFAPSATEADAFGTEDSGFGANPFSSPPEAETHAPVTVVQHPTAEEFGFTTAPAEGLEPADNIFGVEAPAAPLETKRSFFRAPEQAEEKPLTPVPQDLHVHEHVQDGASTGFTEATAFDLHADHHDVDHEAAPAPTHHDDGFAPPEEHHEDFAPPQEHEHHGSHHHDDFAAPEAHHDAFAIEEAENDAFAAPQEQHNGFGHHETQHNEFAPAETHHTPAHEAHDSFGQQPDFFAAQDDGQAPEPPAQPHVEQHVEHHTEPHPQEEQQFGGFDDHSDPFSQPQDQSGHAPFVSPLAAPVQAHSPGAAAPTPKEKHQSSLAHVDSMGSLDHPAAAVESLPTVSPASVLSPVPSLPSPPSSEVINPRAAPPTPAATHADEAPATHGQRSASISLPPFSAPASPSPASLLLATIESLTVSWAPVEGATGYYCDYECRSRAGTDAKTASGWLGTGGRVVNDASPLLSSPRCKITGLQKNSDYVVRITAVKKRRVMLPDGSALEQVLESEPSSVSAPFKTLNPGAEIARLTDTNALLVAENERIPVLEQLIADQEANYSTQVSELGEELHTTQEQLRQAVAEIDRLQSALASKTSDLDAANADIKNLHASLQARSGELGESRAEVRHLKDVIVTKTEEINRNNAEIARLRDTVAGKVSELERAANDAAMQAKVLADRDAEIVTHKTKITDLETVVQNKEKSRQDLMARLEASSSQLSSLSGDKDIVVTKLTDDLAKIMGELQRVQNQLHKAQDMVAYLDPFARVVIDIREKQRKWDAEHDLINTGASAAGASPFGKMSAGRKLGPRPTLTL